VAGAPNEKPVAGVLVCDVPNDKAGDADVVVAGVVELPNPIAPKAIPVALAVVAGALGLNDNVGAIVLAAEGAPNENPVVAGC
jgi:hypothetical protein